MVLNSIHSISFNPKTHHLYAKCIKILNVENNTYFEEFVGYFCTFMEVTNQYFTLVWH